ncbi:GtrA family protein [Nocardioides bizhenqiangii]|uniref:GtrA family protein n=1 Tax=Nocardioides bizhenqiangii TaxID=3095076 RepID=A0ABZ0ZRK5_9ACTN|nr:MULTISPECIES: GtrA family protein [unclassified Nocardioides]MDZ5622698.1 GtrA family protein [Nocardioides sp. HM23]WQQ26965.1 GtrA family protein [Nocardioides sp. HM61]
MVRFAGVGVCNTAIDWALFLVLHDRLGITLANFVSSSAGMVFSFVVNGLFTFRAERLTLRQALLFVATTGAVMWVAQPLLIHGWLWALEQMVDDADLRLAVAKLASIACSLVLNFAAYRLVVWPHLPGASEGRGRARTGGEIE